MESIYRSAQRNLGFRLAVKRSADLILSLIGCLVLLPVFGVILFAVKIDSRGPALYVQERLGVEGKRFRAFKFRTMHGDGEARLAALLAGDAKLRAEYERYHKLRFDPRVTRLGRFLRKTSLDELPQLWNVLLGDMSLVGPRPYLPRELPEMQGTESTILSVKPGIAGLWQASGRSDASFAERVQFDVEYVQTWSLSRDLLVLFQTMRAVFLSRGAF